MPNVNSRAHVLFASLVGTTIEFFDFYIYATAAVLVFPKLFFPPGDPASAKLQALATFALAFFARPLGSAVFGHFGDRIGRKATLVASLMTMGISTVVIGVLPTYPSIGVWAPALLTLCRFGQGFGLGGEWGGAVLLATENASPGRQGWDGMFPQLGAPIGFICSTGVFLALSQLISPEQFLAWGWRIPFLTSALLVLLGLYVRLRLTETAAFARTIQSKRRVQVPMMTVFRDHLRVVVLGIFAATATFVVFYLMTVFALSWGTNELHYSQSDFLLLEMMGVVFFAFTIPMAAWLADRFNSRIVMVGASVALIAFGLVFGALFGSGTHAGVAAFLVLGFSATGLTYGALGMYLAQLFPTPVRYTGCSLTFNFAGILGASPAPYVARELAARYGLQSVGWYLSAAAAISLVALLAMRVGRTSLIEVEGTQVA